jgi:hypothetical protein
MGRRARERVEAEFSWSRTFETLVDLYREAGRAGPARRPAGHGPRRARADRVAGPSARLATAPRPGRPRRLAALAEGRGRARAFRIALLLLPVGVLGNLAYTFLATDRALLGASASCPAATSPLPSG